MSPQPSAAETWNASGITDVFYHPFYWVAASTTQEHLTPESSTEEFLEVELKQFCATVSIFNFTVHLGTYHSAEEAAIAYTFAASSALW